MLYIIKNTFFCITTFYIFSKSLNLTTSRKKNFACCLLSVLLTIISMFSKLIIDGFEIYFLIFLLSISLYKLFMQRYDLTLFVCIFAYSGSFLISLISIALTFPICFYLGEALSYNNLFQIFFYFLIGFTSIFLAILLFRIKKFKNGFPFLRHKEFCEESFLLCILITFIYSFYRYKDKSSNMEFLIIVTIFAILCIFFIVVNYKQSDKHYRYKSYERNINALEYELNMQMSKNNELAENNYELGKLIHRDNKLIPAMESAVTELLQEYNENTALSLLNNIKEISAERNGILDNYYERKYGVATFDNIRVNAIINYMSQKASDFGINFNFSYKGDITKMLDSIVSEEHFCTIVADLIENAIIATKIVTDKHILLDIIATPESYSISVYDSADYFSKEVIKRLGKSRYTTHKKDGGTGFGLMTIFEILKQYNASFSLDETIEYRLYTKCISITFDGKSYNTYNGKLLFKKEL